MLHTVPLASRGLPHHPTNIPFRSLPLSSSSELTIRLSFEKLLHLYTGVAGQLHPEPHLPRDTTQELVALMIQIMDYLQSPSALSDFYAQRALASVFDMIATHCYTEKIPGAPLGRDNPILRVKQYLDEHYAEAIAATDLAALSHCSKGHLFRAFRKAFQVSPLAYQQDLRFEAAQRLLRLTSLRCYEVAQRVGYANIYYFHRQFKRRMGVTPKHYRQSMRGGGQRPV
jgi:AraC-like DNA-binding protein